MWTTTVLREEHRWILRMLECLERLTRDSEEAGRLDAAGAAELLALFQHFADGLHQEREERCLFPRLLARAGSVAERTEVGRLCGEHEQERLAMARMNKELLGGIFGDARSLREFQRAARRYVELHRAHVLHENRTLLVLAERLLLPEDDEAVLLGFTQLEHDGPEAVKRVFERIRSLCARLGVATEATA
jgi:hemerythrin-like domain-containing protein